MTSLIPLVRMPAGTAIEPPPGGLYTTINTMMRELAGCVYPVPVLMFMAVRAECYPIAHIKAQFGKVNKRFDMVSLQPSPFMPAFLAGIIISFVNRFTPMCKGVPHTRSIILQTFSAFPRGGFFTPPLNRAVLIGTQLRTEFGIIIAPIRERLAAVSAHLNLRGITNRPTFFRTEFGSFITVSFYLKRLATNGARFDNPLPEVLASDLVVTFHRAAFGSAESGMERIATNRAYFRSEFHHV